MSIDVTSQLQVLDGAECRRLLSTAVIGRIAYTEGALPAIQPVSFAVHDGQVVIPTRAGSKVAAASRGAIVAFEADSFDTADRTGWNVTVVGPSRVVTDPAEVASLEVLDLPPWTPGPTECYIVIAIRVIRGRRIGPSTPAPGSEVPA